MLPIRTLALVLYCLWTAEGNIVDQHDEIPLPKRNNDSDENEINLKEVETINQLPSNVQLAPKAPSSVELRPNIRNIECSSQSAKLFWDFKKPTDNVTYIIYCKQSNMDSPWQQLNITPPFTKPEAALFLNPNTKYAFQVKALWQDRQGVLHSSANSSIVKCKTKQDTPMRNPDFVSAYNVNNTMVIQWIPLQPEEYGDDYPEYLVGYTKYENTINRKDWLRTSLVNDPKQGQLVVNNIQPDVDYWVRIEAKNKIGMPFLPAKVHKGNQKEKKPSEQPKNFKLEQLIDGRSVKFSWEPVPIRSINGVFNGKCCFSKKDFSGQRLRGIRKDILTKKVNRGKFEYFPKWF